MATFNQLKAQIADDNLAGPSVTDAHITNAINAAIGNYGAIRWWFNERLCNAFSTALPIVKPSDSDIVADLVRADWIDIYEATGDRQYIQRLVYVRPGGGGDINAYPWDGQNDFTTPRTIGQPYFWTIVNSELHFYPFPDKSYIFAITGHFKLGTTDIDDSPWMNVSNAYQLIRHAANRDIATNTTRDQTAQAAASQEEQIWLTRLELENGRRTSRNFVTPVEF